MNAFAAHMLKQEGHAAFAYPIKRRHAVFCSDTIKRIIEGHAVLCSDPIKKNIKCHAVFAVTRYIQRNNIKCLAVFAVTRYI